MRPLHIRKNDKRGGRQDIHLPEYRGFGPLPQRYWGTPVPTENLIRTVRVTDRADVGPANDGNVSIADVHSVNVDEWLASFGRSSDRRVGVHCLPAATVHGGRQAA